MTVFRFPLLTTLALAAVLHAAPVRAHPGHGDELPPAPSGTGAPRAEAHSDLFELVITVRGGAAVLYLDRFATNEPVEGAKVEVAEGDATLTAEPQPDGTYRLQAPWLAQPGRHALGFTVTAGSDADLLDASLDLPADGHAASASPAGPWARVQAGVQASLGDRRGPVIAGFGFLLGVFTTLLFQARGRWRVAMGGMALLSGLLVAGAALCPASACPSSMSSSPGARTSTATASRWPSASPPCGSSFRPTSCRRWGRSRPSWARLCWWP